eukprot:754261-Hanusia_phi.AAC.1
MEEMSKSADPMALARMEDGKGRLRRSGRQHRHESALVPSSHLPVGSVIRSSLPPPSLMNAQDYFMDDAMGLMVYFL